MVSLNDTPLCALDGRHYSQYSLFYTHELNINTTKSSSVFPSPKIVRAAYVPILQDNTTRRQLSNENWSSLFNNLLDHIIRLTSLIPLLLPTLLLTLILLLILRLILLLRILLRCPRVTLLSRRICGSIIPKTGGLALR
jgi:hypothetical protein